LALIIRVNLDAKMASFNRLEPGRVLDGAPDALGDGGYLDVMDAQFRERVDNGVDDGPRAGVAPAASPERTPKRPGIGCGHVRR